MAKYNTAFVSKMREIYRSIITRIAKTGKTEDSDILFINFYKDEIENKITK